MSVLPVLKFPDRRLNRSAKRVLKFSANEKRIIQDLIDTLYSSPKTIGLAATQVGIPLQIFVMDLLAGKAKSKGAMVFINPEIVSFKNPILSREGCLSVPEYTGNVLRWSQLKCTALSEAGKSFDMMATNLEAICIQHEIDHLKGKLFLDHIQSPRSDLFPRKNYATCPGLLKEPR